MDPPPGHIDAQGARIEKVTQVNVGRSEGGVSLPITPGPGRTILDITHHPKDAGNLPTHNITPDLLVRHASFVGRAAELTALHERLTAPRAAGDTKAEAVVHAVPGEGGIGKTQLALAYLIEYAEHWPHRWWIDGSLGRLDDSCKALAKRLALGLPDDAPGDIVRGALAERLSHSGRHLLVIDNAEPREGAAAPAGPAGGPWHDYERLTLAPPSRVLLTTRFTDRLEEFATPFELGVLSAPDALLILRAARPAFEDGRADGDLNAIADHLGYLGLALGYAAAWLRVHSLGTPAELLAAIRAAELDDAHPLEDPGLTGRAAKYQRSTAAALALHLTPLDGRPAMAVAVAAAFCDPERIPVALLAKAAGLSRDRAEQAVGLLKGRSIVTLSAIDDPALAAAEWGHVSLHRLTQSMLRRRAWTKDRKGTLKVLARLRTALADVLEDWTHHKNFAERVRATPHAAALATHLDARMPELPPRRPSGLDQFDVAMLHHRLAEHLENAGDLRGARAHIDAAVAWGEARGRDSDKDTAIWRASRATVRQAQGDLAGALDDITFSIDWGLRQAPVDERSVAIRRATRAGIRQDHGDLAGALDDITFSIDWGLRQAPVDERSVAIRRATRAGIRQAQGDLAGALDDITFSIDWGLRQTPVNERGVAMDRATRAGIRRDQGDCAGALDDITFSIDFLLRQTPVDERSVAIWRATRAGIRRAQGDLAGALDDITFSIDWGLRQTPVDERSVAILRATRAGIRQDQGDLAGALDDITFSIDWGLRQTPVDERSVAIWRATRAGIRQDQGDLAGALDDITFSIDWGLRQTPVDERSVAIWRATRAGIRKDQGDLAGALDDITFSIDFESKQTPLNERGLAILRATRAGIRQDQGDLAGALDDITFSIDWGLRQTPVDERGVAIDRATRAGIRQDQGDCAGALDDITFALAWFEEKLPADTRSLGILRRRKAAIEAAMGT